MAITIADGLLIAAALTLDRNKSIKSWPFLTDKARRFQCSITNAGRCPRVL
jgi:hypothetical protein